MVLSLSQIAVNTPLMDLRDFLSYLSSATNLRCLTPKKALEGEDCGFLAANLYAQSIFGEDVLVNLSCEKTRPADPLSPINGHIRIRAKSQGMALSMGDKVRHNHMPINHIHALKSQCQLFNMNSCWQRLASLKFSSSQPIS